MAVKSPWSVKGVSQEDRDQAKSAARRAGVPVGVWLSRQIRAHGAPAHVSAEGPDSEGNAADAEEQTDNHGPAGRLDGQAARAPNRGMANRGGPDSRFTFGPGQWSTATEAIESGRISQPPPQPWPAARPPVVAVAPPPPSVQQALLPAAGPGSMMPMYQQGVPMASHWTMPPMAHPMYVGQAAQSSVDKADSEAIKAFEEELETLREKLAAVETQTKRQIEEINSRLDRLDGLARDVEALRDERGEDREPSYSTAPVERAVMRLSERLQRIEDAVLPPDSGGNFFSRLFRRG